MAWDKNRPYAPFWNRTDYRQEFFGSMDSYNDGADVTAEMIDVQYTDTSSESSHMERVDIVVFDGDEPVDRIIISGATVIVDND